MKDYVIAIAKDLGYILWTGLFAIGVIMGTKDIYDHYRG